MRVVDAADTPTLTAALRAALAGGDAVLPVAADATGIATPARQQGAGEHSTAPGRFDLAQAAAERGAALVIETSGSTGVPKRVALTAAALRASAEATTAWCDAAVGRRPSSRQWLLCLPGHYIAGAQVLVRSILAESTPVVLAGPFTAEAFLAAAERMGAEARYVSLVPVQLQRLLGSSEALGATPTATAARLDATMRRFDAILVGGQATPPSLREAVTARGWRIVTTYGASETAGGCVYNGEPLPGVTLRIHDGEVLITAPQLAAGYLGDPARDAATFVNLDGQRWYRTSDAGAVGADGRLRIHGRLDHVIISGGEKVNLDVVERLAQSLPGFAQALAVAVPHPEWGETPALVVEGARPGVVPAPDAVREVCGQAGRAARPDAVVTIAELPRLASGKPDRIRATALARAALVRQSMP